MSRTRIAWARHRIVQLSLPAASSAAARRAMGRLVARARLSTPARTVLTPSVTPRMSLGFPLACHNSAWIRSASGRKGVEHTPHQNDDLGVLPTPDPAPPRVHTQKAAQAHHPDARRRLRVWCRPGRSA